MRRTRAFPIVVSGPSGAGKTTVVSEAISRGGLLRNSISVTTRLPRGDEVEGEAYYFVSEKEFEGLKRGKLIEWARVHDHFYGTPIDGVEEALAQGHDVVLNIDVQGGKAVKKAFPEAVLIFILTPSREVLESRIRKRATDVSGEIDKRLENAWQEIRRATGYDYIVENDQLENTVDTVLAIIRAERHRRERYSTDYIERFRGK